MLDVHHMCHQCLERDSWQDAPSSETVHYCAVVSGRCRGALGSIQSLALRRRVSVASGHGVHVIPDAA
jgi:hypothetical protein